MSKDKNQGIPHNIKNSTSEPLFQTMLEGCTEYKVDAPNGNYIVQMFFVEPQIKATENIYNLSGMSTDIKREQRVFDIKINNTLIEKNLNLAKAYPEKYGVTISSTIKVIENEGLTLSFISTEGQPVISAILIEKTD